MSKMDNNDTKLLQLLCRDSKLSVQQLSKETGLPPTTVHNRIKRLEREGIIKGYTVLVDNAAIGREVTAYVLITTVYRLPTGGRVSQEDVAREVKSLGAEEVSIVAGGSDIIAKVHAKNVAELNEFVVRKLRVVDGVDKTQTMIVLSQPF
jgi:Lrp/AsnC family leucine-responsive transcriptional regulator